MARNWDTHRNYDFYYVYYIPSHLKAALIRHIVRESEKGITAADLRSILLPPPGDEADDDEHVTQNDHVCYLDLSGSLGKSLRLKELSSLLFPSGEPSATASVEDSWEEVAAAPAPRGPLIPHLSHLSLAVKPGAKPHPSWKQLLDISSKLGTLTHLSLAYWPEPCLTPQAARTSVSTPQGRSIPYAGTNLYSHSLDDEWSEALLILRTFSRNLYALEYLDLTGCAAWFRALMLDAGHDSVDWAGSWGKVTELHLKIGWELDEDSSPSARELFSHGCRAARDVERHIVAARAGRGRFIHVERDVMPDRFAIN